MAVSRRWLLHSAICAASDTSMVSSAVASRRPRPPAPRRRPPALPVGASPPASLAAGRGGLPTALVEPPRRRSAGYRSTSTGAATGALYHGPSLPRRQRPQRRPLVPLEAVQRIFAGRDVRTDVGDALLPAPRLAVQIRVADERSAVDEVRLHVADRPLHVALLAGPARTAGASPEHPVVGEALELRVHDQLLAVVAAVRSHYRPHLVEQQLPAERRRSAERVLSAQRTARSSSSADRTASTSARE